MSKQIETSCTVLSLALIENDKGEAAAFSLARWFGRSCEALLVSSPKEEDTEPPYQSYKNRRSRGLKRRAEEVGIEIDINAISFEATLTNLNVSSPEKILILVQPAHPLERQTLGFRRLIAATQTTPASIVYAPNEGGASSGDILVVSQSGDRAAMSFAAKLIEQKSSGTAYRSNAQTLQQLRDEVKHRGKHNRYALIILGASSLSQTPASLIKLAALSATPILVLENEEKG